MNLPKGILICNLSSPLTFVALTRFVSAILESEREAPNEMPVKRISQEAKSARVFSQPHKQPKMFRVGLYARVSTNDQQTLANAESRDSGADR